MRLSGRQVKKFRQSCAKLRKVRDKLPRTTRIFTQSFSRPSPRFFCVLWILHFEVRNVGIYLILRSQSRYQVVTNRVTTALFLN